MKYGYLPYRDFFDGKGPYLFFLEYIGQLICEGRTGAFIIQSVLFCVAMLFFDETIGVGRKQRSVFEVFLLLPVYLMAIFSVGGGGLTEDLSLLPISVCLFLGVRYLNGEKKHSPLFALVYGAAFGILSFLRINNSAEICAVVLTIFIVLVSRREWKNIFYNIIAFVVGFILAILPVILFYMSQHILSDMLYQVFIYGWKYSKLVKQSGLVSLFTGAYRLSVLPIGIGLVASLVFFEKRNWQSTLLIWISSIAAVMAVSISGRNFEHYYVLFLPVVVLDVWYLRSMMINTKKWKKFLSIAFTIVYVISFWGIGKLDFDYMDKNVINEIDSTTDNSIMDASSNIGEGTVYCWTPNPRWYSVAGRFPSFKHCYWHNDQMNTDPAIRDELSDMFLNNPPDWLVLENNDNELPDFVTQSVDTYFVEVYENDYWIVYKNSNSQW